ncbi:MAG: hypothetical protein WC136_08935 [Sphaerochaeta sp.]|jgi:hypothetical protein
MKYFINKNLIIEGFVLDTVGKLSNYIKRDEPKEEPEPEQKPKSKSLFSALSDRKNQMEQMSRDLTESGSPIVPLGGVSKTVNLYKTK